MFLRRTIPQDWLEQAEFLVAVDALVTGLVYTVGPKELRGSTTFYYIQQLPGGIVAFGWTCLVVALLLCLGRFTTWVSFIKWGHAIGAAVYILFGGLILVATLPSLLPFLPLWDGHAESGAGWMHLGIIAWIHYQLGVSRPPLRRVK